MLIRDLTLTRVRHPEYEDSFEDWMLWRDTYRSGSRYVRKYLEKFSHRESEEEFAMRKRLTPCPSFAKSAIDDIINNIFQRMSDIIRVGGPKSYQDVIGGLNQGVDLLGSSMNYFIGKRLLPELLNMRRVGVYIDMPPVGNMTLLDVQLQKIRPYLYIYTSEEICNWQYGPYKDYVLFKSLLLKETYDVIHPIYNMPVERTDRYRYMYVGKDGYVHCEFYNKDNTMIDLYGQPTVETYTLPLTQIPFVLFQLPHSLLEDASRYQLALLQMLSSDIWYCLKGNYPFYTEQMDFRAGTPFNKPADTGGFQREGTASGQVAQDEEIRVGTMTGRGYPIGADRPGFINPSDVPLRASMDKQEQMKAEIRQLINLSVANVAPAAKQQAADSKQFDNQGLEAGLAAIGLELERGERLMSILWSMYEENAEIASVFYPDKYSLKSDSERLTEAESLLALIPSVPSITFQREIAKVAVRVLLGHKIPRPVLDKVFAEVDKAEILAVNPEQLIATVTAGILDKGNAAMAFMYPKDAVDKANKEHAERLAVISAQQVKTSQAMPGAARGNPDGSADPNDGKTERDSANKTEKDPIAQDKTRGKGT